MMMYQSLSMAARPLSTTIVKTFNEDRKNTRTCASARVKKFDCAHDGYRNRTRV